MSTTEEKEYQKEYYKNNKEKVLKRTSIYGKSHLAQNRPRRVLEWNRYRMELLLEVGGCKCAKCGFSDWRALQIDHIKGGGSKELKNKYGIYTKIKSPKYYLEHIRLHKKDYQVLCANCNWIKRYENKENQ